MRLRLPPAPPLNNAFFNVHGRGRTKSARYRRWLAAADAYYVLQKLGAAGKIEVPFQCRMTFPPLAGDIDGRAKLILDWLVSRNLTIDDRHCKKLTLVKDDTRNKLDMVDIEVAPYAP